MAAQNLRVDFNRADDDDIVWAYRDRSDDPDGLDPGMFLRLYDWEGNECLGVVDRIEGLLVYVVLQLGTWRDAHPVTVEDAQPDLVSALITSVLRIPPVERETTTWPTPIPPVAA